MPRVDLPDHPPARRRAPEPTPPPPVQPLAQASSPSAPSVPAAPMRSPARTTPPATATATPSGRKRLTFVTGNKGKAAEMGALLAPLGWEVVADGRGYPEIQADTLREVTAAGARHLLDTGLQPPFILEDSGLFVAALKGFPGVYTRHALETIGLDGLLRLLQDVELEMRSAAFLADLALVDASGTVHHFEGRCPGRIADRIEGSAGFGFDPVFIPEGHAQTFAQMDVAAKGAVSHRGRVAMLLARHLAQAATP